jgi:hypothetical protein
MKRAIILLLLVLLAIFSGFYQEKLKISINYILDEGAKVPGFDALTPEKKMEYIEQARIAAPFDYYHNHSTITWLYRLDAKQLFILKWGVTGFFLIWFLLVNVFLLRVLNVHNQVLRFLPWIYGALILLSILLFVSGAITGLQQSAYTLSRKIMGALQSVIPALILWPASMIFNHSGLKLPNERNE